MHVSVLLAGKLKLKLNATVLIMLWKCVMLVGLFCF